MRVSQNKSQPETKNLSINHLQMFLPLLQKLKNQFMLRASSVKVNTHSGVVLYLRKRPQLNELFSAQNRLCFVCLQPDHMFRKSSKALKCTKPGCESTHNFLLHGAEKVFSVRSANKEINISNNTSHSNSDSIAPPNRNKPQTSSSNVAGSPSYKKLKGTPSCASIGNKLTHRRDHCPCNVRFLL